MKRLFSFIIVVVLFTSCESGWDSESKELFHKSCMDDTKGQGKDDAAAKSICDCRLEKIMKKYPDVDDALMNIEAVINDPEIAGCK